MNANNQLCVKFLHCGNRNIANPGDRLEKSIFYVPMGLFPMAGKLKENGFDVEIIHLDLEEKTNIEEILDFDTLDVVGLDCHWVNQSIGVLNTAELIKKIKPDVFIVLGGYTASFFVEEILKNYPYVDAIIRGDGEVPIVELCNALQANLNSTDRDNHKNHFGMVRNLAWRGSYSEIIINEFSYVASSEDMNQLDFAEIQLLRNWRYYRDLSRHWSSFSAINQLPIFFLEIGRGCNYHCTFCGGNSNAQRHLSNRKQLSIRSIDSVIASIKKASSFGYSHFFASFEFENSDQWYIKLFQRIKEEKLEISFGYSSMGLPSKPLVDQLSKTFGQVIIEISPETSDLNLRKTNKDPRIFYTNEELEECLDYINTKPNINVQLYFGYLLPFDTQETVFNTMAYITELFFKYSPFAEFIYSNLSTDPCSSLYFQPNIYKIDIDVQSFDDYLRKLEEIYIIRKEIPFGGMSLFKPRCITDIEAADLKNKADLFNKIISYFGHSVLRILNRIVNFEIIADYLKELDLSMTLERKFILGGIKDLLLGLCNESNIRDIEIIHSIDEEFKKAPLQAIKTNHWNKGKTKELIIITEEEKNKICSKFQKVKESIHADFDI